MSKSRARRVYILAFIWLSVVAGLAILFYPRASRLEIRGAISSKDLAEIKRLHRVVCPKVWSGIYPKWLPVALERRISVTMNPIEIIAVPSESRAIVVYRGFELYHYDQNGRHRRGLASYTLERGANGWQRTSPVSPSIGTRVLTNPPPLLGWQRTQPGFPIIGSPVPTNNLPQRARREDSAKMQPGSPSR
jgi:hypothetical protein